MAILGSLEEVERVLFDVVATGYQDHPSAGLWFCHGAPPSVSGV